MTIQNTRTNRSTVSFTFCWKMLGGMRHFRWTSFKMAMVTTTHWLWQLNLKTLTMPSVKKDMGQLEFSDTTSGCVNWYNHYRKLLGSSINFFFFLQVLTCLWDPKSILRKKTILILHTKMTLPRWYYYPQSTVSLSIFKL